MKAESINKVARKSVRVWNNSYERELNRLTLQTNFSEGFWASAAQNDNNRIEAAECADYDVLLFLKAFPKRLRRKALKKAGDLDPWLAEVGEIRR